MSLQSTLSLAFLLLTSCLPSVATTIDFEAQGTSASSSFNGRPANLTVGIASFAGGQLLRNSPGAIDTTAVYATTNLVSGAYLNPLIITFTSPVDNVSLNLVNAIPDTYTLASGSSSQSLFANADSSVTLSLAGVGFSQLSVSGAQSFGWDFAIDNVTFTAATTAVPEPAAILPLLITIGILLARRKQTSNPQLCK